MAEFTPPQLDQLEDALESLEGVDDLASLGLEESLTNRLRDYQDVMSLSREALPLEEVSDSVLAGVLAEAAQSPAASTEAKVGLWARWRKTILPVAALTGSTAAVLWLVRPDQPPEDLAHVAETRIEEDSADRAATAAGDSDDAALRGAAAKGTLEAADRKEAEAAEDAEPVQAESPAPPAQEEAKPDAIRPKKNSAKSKMSDSEQDQAPVKQQSLGDKQDAWETLSRAHALRRSGRCHDAKPLYQQVLRQAPNSQAKARAHAGLGLCREEDGGDASAAYGDARALEPNIDVFIESERDDSQAIGKKKGKPSPKKKSKARRPDDAYESLDD